MKADMDKLKPGQVIGKALEEFYGMEGKIKIMANGINTKRQTAPSGAVCQIY